MRAEAAEVRKIPEPIMEPTTIIVASRSPRLLTRLWERLSFFFSLMG